MCVCVCVCACVCMCVCIYMNASQNSRFIFFILYFDLSSNYKKQTFVGLKKLVFLSHE